MIDDYGLISAIFDHGVLIAWHALRLWGLPNSRKAGNCPAPAKNAVSR
jgi:hypothetical protein